MQRERDAGGVAHRVDVAMNANEGDGASDTDDASTRTAQFDSDETRAATTSTAIRDRAV